ncbi:MAG: DUF5053 domain-containing protein [Candidatus Symbiothrix sp.]|jgi:hypothetical protein|nr:DUF5053 domain-containing protein [Candidatus Symbiothrix sp.]
MDAKKEIEKFKKEFATLRNATSEKKAEFDARFKNFIASQSKEGKKELAGAFFEGAKQECEKAKEIANYIDIRLKMDKILDIVSIAYISEKYFHKSRSWFTQRLNNNIVNGVPASFSKEELKVLSDALSDISDVMKSTARSIAC